MARRLYVSHAWEHDVKGAGAEEEPAKIITPDAKSEPAEEDQPPAGYPTDEEITARPLAQSPMDRPWFWFILVLLMFVIVAVLIALFIFLGDPCFSREHDWITCTGSVAGQKLAAAYYAALKVVGEPAKAAAVAHNLYLHNPEAFRPPPYTVRHPNEPIHQAAHQHKILTLQSCSYENKIVTLAVPNIDRGAQLTCYYEANQESVPRILSQKDIVSSNIVRFESDQPPIALRLVNPNSQSCFWSQTPEPYLTFTQIEHKNDCLLGSVVVNNPSKAPILWTPNNQEVQFFLLNGNNQVQLRTSASLDHATLRCDFSFEVAADQPAFVRAVWQKSRAGDIKSRLLSRRLASG